MIPVLMRDHQHVDTAGGLPDMRHPALHLFSGVGRAFENAAVDENVHLPLDTRKRQQETIAQPVAIHAYSHLGHWSPLKPVQNGKWLFAAAPAEIRGMERTPGHISHRSEERRVGKEC